ncbi:hypothetical protein JCM19237_4973 [Photobacterium aphoticum]|uniref:Uncharacterized protein n=1 Tax=Photobacterium aphoticum TaxID=754436 RepID=A0A090QG29_9GAMM|nr:hypothetical protein JCM19237_4973 [Photobacterium aphoticum]
MFKDTTVRYCQLLGVAAWMMSLPVQADADAPMHCLTAEEVEVLLLESFPSLVLSGTEVISVDDFTPADEDVEPLVSPSLTS